MVTKTIKTKEPKTPAGRIRKLRRLVEQQERRLESQHAMITAQNDARGMDRVAIETLRAQLQQLDPIEVAANNYVNAVLRLPSIESELNATQEALIGVILSHRRNNGLTARTVAPARKLVPIERTVSERINAKREHFGSDTPDEKYESNWARDKQV